MTAPLTDAQIQSLREAAQKATPGPWTGHWVRMGGDASIAAGENLVASVRYESDTTRRDANAAYIALANPATILALLDEREEFLAAVAAPDQGLWRFWNAKAVAMVAERDAIRAERDALQSDLEFLFGMEETTAPGATRLPLVRQCRERAEAAEADAARLRKAMEEIHDGYGPHHESTFCRYTARSALTTKGTAE